MKICLLRTQKETKSTVLVLEEKSLKVKFYWLHREMSVQCQNTILIKAKKVLTLKNDRLFQ